MLAQRLKELHEQRTKLHLHMKEVGNKLDRSKGEWPDKESEETWTRLNAEFDKISERCGPCRRRSSGSRKSPRGWMN
ncbi:MAG: hypothetical protein HC841_00525 [Verrucomicrobiae bacterium]|nr:hypothetical protein [Verrucomicrobiae bacterium]